MGAITITGINHVALWVRNLKHSVSWYQEVLARSVTEWEPAKNPASRIRFTEEEKMSEMQMECFIRANLLSSENSFV